jgi:transcriptional regulator with XRE-family HTH domain
MKSTEKWFGELLDSCKDDFEFRLEEQVFELTEQIAKRLKDNKISRKQFAEKMGISPAAVSKVLNGNPNFTIRTLLTMADALKTELNIEFKDKITCVPKVANQTTASDVVNVVAPKSYPYDVADTPPPWMLPKTTSACNNF